VLLSVELLLVVVGSDVDGGGFLTTFSATSVIGAPKSIEPVENASIYFAFSAAILSAVEVEELVELSEVSSSSSGYIS